MSSLFIPPVHNRHKTDSRLNYLSKRPPKFKNRTSSSGELAINDISAKTRLIISFARKLHKVKFSTEEQVEKILADLKHRAAKQNEHPPKYLHRTISSYQAAYRTKKKI